MMTQLYTFLARLKENNRRDWFQEHKAEYDQLRAWWTDQVQILIDRMSEFEPALSHVRAKDCLYRIYRDTRFSPDKTPYKTYFSALISPTGRHCDKASYYFHQGVDGNVLAGGIWCPEPKVLKKLRKAIVDNIEEFREIIDNPLMVKYFPDWDGEKLKTAPKGYDRDHPDIDLLRLTEYCKFMELPAKTFEKEGWQQEVADIFRVIKPLNDFLNYSIDE